MDTLGFITDGVYDYRGKVFDYDLHLTPLTVIDPRYIRFFKCIFNKPVLIENLVFENISISFSDCIFKEEVGIKNCRLLDLKFNEVTSFKDISIEKIFIRGFKFCGKNFTSGDFYMHESNVTHIFDCSRLENFIGKFVVDINRNQEGCEFLRSSFRKSSFKDLQLHGQLGNVDFENATIAQSTLFFDVIFWESYFANAVLGKITRFNGCEFKSKVSFKDCGSEETKISFEISTFKGHSFFTDARFNHFSISDCSFESRTSFTGLKANTVNLHLVNFNKLAFFDDLRVFNIEKENFFSKLPNSEAKKWRHTLRQIKQELQKTENRIDYNRFRSYELAAYYRELKWNKNFKDWFILTATKVVTGFDHSWRRALGFTIIAAGLFYSLFYISENYMQTLALSQWRQFLSGYFRFLIVTDFYNPLADGRSYIDNTNTIGWFIFILGKIFIAFGIYEMIQAFRKFKS